MYTEFYNLREKPFNLSPSARFLYLGEVHKEALAFLTYGVVERKGFILLTGEVGTGKTTMIQALLANLDKNVEYIYLSNPLFSVKDFMDYLVFSVFKKKLRFRSKADFLIQFEEFLKERLQHQKIFVLIIDEAQKLSLELLEEVRLLSNMETADEKMINIFLVGQPELNDILSQPRCRPLLQRISIRYHLKPLDSEGTQEYITTRLKIAGSHNENKIFTKDAIKAFYQYSEGYPRVINILADNVLLLGYSRGKREISANMVKEVYEDLQLETSFIKSGLKKKPDPVAAIKTGRSRINRYWLWAIILLVIIFFLSFYLSKHGKNLFRQLAGDKPLNESASQDIAIGEEKSDLKKNDQGINQIAKNDNTSEQTGFKNENMPMEEGTGVMAMPLIGEFGLAEGKDVSIGKVEEKHAEAFKKSVSKDDNNIWPKTIIAKEGDTITDLISNVYGFVNEEIINFVKKSNPHIKDINFIDVGQRIYFPQRSIGKQNAGQRYTVHIASYKPFDQARNLFQKLIEKGYEVYIMPISDDHNAKIFRITLGNFENEQDADQFASLILKERLSDYANVIQLETR